MPEYSALNELKSSLPPKRKGNPNWIKGVSRPAPKGNGKKSTGLQDPGPRTRLLLEKYGTEAIIAALEDRKELKKYSSYDAMLIVGLGNALKGSDAARESMLNRMFGKVPDKQINFNLNVETNPEQLSNRAMALLGSLGLEKNGEEELIED